MFEVISCCWWSIIPSCPVFWCVHSWVFYFSGANCGFKPCTWNLRRLPPWGVVGNLWRCRISVELKCRKVWICQGKCLGHVDREHAIALLKSYGRVEICVFSLFFVDVRTFCLICTHLSSVLNSMLNKSSLTFRTAADAQGDFPQGALSNVFVEGRALQWFLSRLRRLPSPIFIQHHRSSYMLRLAPCVQVMDELLNHLVKTDVLYRRFAVRNKVTRSPHGSAWQCWTRHLWDFALKLIYRKSVAVFWWPTQPRYMHLSSLLYKFKSAKS